MYVHKLNVDIVTVNSFIHFHVHNIRFTAKTSSPLERTLFGLEATCFFLLLVFTCIQFLLLKRMEYLQIGMEIWMLCIQKMLN
jgi:hypothetical protein